MLAVAIFLGVLIFASLIGAAAFLFVRRYSLWVAIPVTALCTFLALILSATAYFLAGVALPANDEKSELEKIEILIDAAGKPMSIDVRAVNHHPPSILRLGPDGPTDDLDASRWTQQRLDKLDATRIEPDFKLVIAYPANSGVNNDVTIALDVYPIATSLPERELKAVLRSSHSFKAWTTQNCEPKTDSDGVAACVTNQGSPKLIEFLWTASPSSPGLKEFAIQFPSLWHGNEWKAILSKNSDPLMNTRCKEYGEVRRNCLYALVLLSPSTPSYGSSQGEFSVNLSRPEVRFPIKVYATLGVSSYTYSWLALIGVVLSSALGSGWLFKIGDLIKSRREKPKHQPIHK